MKLILTRSRHVWNGYLIMLLQQINNVNCWFWQQILPGIHMLWLVTRSASLKHINKYRTLRFQWEIRKILWQPLSSGAMPESVWPVLKWKIFIFFFFLFFFSFFFLKVQMLERFFLCPQLWKYWEGIFPLLCLSICSLLPNFFLIFQTVFELWLWCLKDLVGLRSISSD